MIIPSNQATNPPSELNSDSSIGGAVSRTGALWRMPIRHDVLLLESIDEVLTDLFGRRAKETIYDRLERNCHLARDEIPKHLDLFYSLLESNLGNGWKTIEKAIAKRLHAKLEEAKAALVK